MGSMKIAEGSIVKKFFQRTHAARFAVFFGFVALIASTSLGAEQWKPKRTHAVIVGVLEWKDGKNDLSPFSKRNRKDRELRDLLIKRGTPAENVTMLLGREATLLKIR